jgi:hypothetical protein
MMKLVTIVILSIGMTLAAVAQVDLNGVDVSQLPKAEEAFRVSRVGEPQRTETRDRLLEVFAAVQAKYAVSSEGKIVLQNPPMGSQQVQGVVVQIISPKEYILGCVSGLLKLTTVENRDWKTGENEVATVIPTGVTQYLDGTGMRRAVTSYQQLPGTTSPTRAQFLAAIKSGQSFTVAIVEKRDNPASGGMDYIWAKDAAGAQTNKKIPVDPVVPVLVTYTVTW